MTTRYTIFRAYQRPDVRSGEIVKTGQTLAQAQAHCKDPQSQSATCTTTAGTRRTEQFGSWYDAYRAEN